MSRFGTKPGTRSATGAKHPTGGRAARGRAALVGVLSLLVLVVAGPVSADPLTGGFSPTIIGERADLNGDGVVNGRDDSNAFCEDPSIIDGQLDYNAWASPNDGTAGNGRSRRTTFTLIGVAGTAGRRSRSRSRAAVQVANGWLHVFSGGRSGHRTSAIPTSPGRRSPAGSTRTAMSRSPATATIRVDRAGRGRWARDPRTRPTCSGTQRRTSRVLVASSQGDNGLVDSTATRSPTWRIRAPAVSSASIWLQAWCKGQHRPGSRLRRRRTRTP